MGLLIIDLQKAYHMGPDAASMDSACEYINAILPFFRAKRLPITWIRHVDKSDDSEEGSPGFRATVWSIACSPRIGARKTSI
jgi:nicotinamidase-related amidase